MESVQAQSFTDYECFIVDNGSEDGSLERLPELDARFTIMALGENTGFARGNNLAAKDANGDWIALLNPDAFARTDWLENLLAATEIAPNVTMVGSTQYMALEDNVFDGLGDYYHAFGLAWRAGFGKTTHPIETREAFGPCGAGAFYHSKTFARLGGFDERFFCYHEDVDLAYRMRLDGGICIQSAEAIIDHVSSGISGRASDFAVYHGTRNRIWTFVKNTPFTLACILFPIHILMNIFILFWALFRPGRFKPTWRGIKDSLILDGPSFSWNSVMRRKKDRNISLWVLLRAFAWSPVKVYKRQVPNSGRPIKPPYMQNIPKLK